MAAAPDALHTPKDIGPFHMPWQSLQEGLSLKIQSRLALSQLRLAFGTVSAAHTGWESITAALAADRAPRRRGPQCQRLKAERLGVGSVPSRAV